MGKYQELATCLWGSQGDRADRGLNKPSNDTSLDLNVPRDQISAADCVSGFTCVRRKHPSQGRGPCFIDDNMHSLNLQQKHPWNMKSTSTRHDQGQSAALIVITYTSSRVAK